MTTKTLPFYPLDTLLQARRYPLLQLWDGIASANDWTARADPVRRGGWDKDGEPARHEFDIVHSLLRPDRVLLDNAQDYLDQTPAVLETALAVQTRDDDMVTLTRPGDGFTMTIQRLYHDTLVQDGDALLAVYNPGRGAYVLVVRPVGDRQVVMAAIRAVGGSSEAFHEAVTRGRLPTISSAFSL